jgi:hypothetical protein
MTEGTIHWRASASLLALTGILIAGTGLYFIALRPPFLPEDIRYIGLSADEVSALQPRLAPWLARVFTVLGGHALATGLLLTVLAATAFRTRRPLAFFGALAGGSASIGLMAAVNFAIGSDFRWVLLAFALVWAASLALYVLEAKAPRFTSPNHAKETDHETP